MFKVLNTVLWIWNFSEHDKINYVLTTITGWKKVMLTVRVIVKQNFNLEDNKQSLPRQNCVQIVLYPLNV